MDDKKLIQIIEGMTRRIIFLECQMIALQGMLAKRWNPIDPLSSRSEFDNEFDLGLEKAVDACKELLSPSQGADEVVDKLLRAYSGPKQ